MEELFEVKRIPSYPKVWNIGTNQVKEIFDSPVVVQEKIDGSQISFGIIDGQLKMRSKNADMFSGNPDGMFSKGIQTIMEIEHLLMPGYYYRGEYLQSPKHNSLTYGRVPRGHIILFDIGREDGSYLSIDDFRDEADRLNLEYVPTYYIGKIDSVDQVKEFMNSTPALGGDVKIEGLVFKNYSKWTSDGKTMMCKFVSEEFKEKHAEDWGERNPSQKDFVEIIVETYKTDRRWEKAIEHLRDAGRLEWSPKDIGELIKEVKRDVREECEEEIKEKLFNHFWPTIERRLTGGLPEFYKNKLVERQFESNE